MNARTRKTRPKSIPPKRTPTPKTPPEIEITLDLNLDGKYRRERWTKCDLEEYLSQVAEQDVNLSPTVARLYFFLASAYDGLMAITGGEVLRQIVIRLPEVAQ